MSHYSQQNTFGRTDLPIATASQNSANGGFITPKRPLLRYHGGKWRLAPWIIGHFPQHDIYVEPFGGAASVLLQKSRCKTEVWNDLDRSLFHLFMLLRSPQHTEKLIKECALTPFARNEFDLSYELSGDMYERCRRLIVRSFFGYGSKSCVSKTKNGFRCLRTGDASPAVDWARYPAALSVIARRMQGVVIENGPALDIIQRFDRSETLFYCDPPYLHNTRNLKEGKYYYEMSDDDHCALAKVLHEVTGMVIISGYPSDLYNELYADWQCVSRKSYADKASPRTECLWLSPKVTAHLHIQMGLLKVGAL